MEIWSAIELLRAERYAELDSYFNEKQRAWEQGEIDDFTLRKFYCLNNTARIDLLPYMTSWIEMFPNSYAAHHIKAELLLSIAWRARGDATSDVTVEQRFKKMQQYFDLAAVHVENALNLTSLPILTLLIWSKIDAAGCYPKQFSNHKIWFESLLPQSDLLCEHKMWRLNPKWGGDEHTLDQFMLTLRKRDTKKDQLLVLEAIYLSEKADIMFCNGRVDSAINLLNNSLKFDRSAHTLMQLGNIYMFNNAYAEAVAYLTESARLEPSYYNYYYLASAYYELDQKQEAIAAYEKALDLGHGDAAHGLSCIARDELSSPTLNEKNKLWLEQGIAQYSDLSMTECASLHLLGILGHKQNDALAVKWWKIAASWGNGMSAYNLALSYWDGRYRERKDYKQAFYYAKIAVTVNYEQAYGVLGRMYYMGHGTPVCYETALPYLSMASEQNDAEAIRFLIYIFWFGRGTAVNRKTAQEWLNVLSQLDRKEYKCARRKTKSLLGFGMSLFIQWKQKLIG